MESHNTASSGRTPKCRATWHLQAGACCLPQKRLTSVNANKPRRPLGKLALALPQHGLGKSKPLLLLGAPRTETGNLPGTCKSTFHAWGVSKGHTGCQGFHGASGQVSCVLTTAVRPAHSETPHKAPPRQRCCLINTSTYNEDSTNGQNSTTNLCCHAGFLAWETERPLLVAHCYFSTNHASAYFVAWQ